MVDFKFADIGEGIHEGVILKWLFKEGDKVEEGETLCIVETDKVNAEIPAPESGILKKRGAEVGETITVGETLALIDDGDADVKVEETDGNDKETPEEEATTEEQDTEDDDEETGKISEKNDDSASVVGALESSDEVMEASSEHTEESQSESSTRTLATPVARKMAKDYGVDINTLKGSGESGRVMKKDILAAAKGETGTSPKASPQKQTAYGMPKIPQENTRRVKISKLRKSIVDAMNKSNTLIPATTVMDEFDVTELVTFRKEQKARAEKYNVKITYLPLIIKAVILTLKAYPVFNASFDHETDEIIYKDYFNIGIAVDTEKGLIVPNIKQTDQKSIFELAKEVDTFATKARDGKIQLNDLQNTTFSITNYGAFGSKLGTPIINHPEVAILGMGAITKKPVVVDGEIVIRDLFPVSLTIDHRVIDGGDAGRFMVKLRELLSDPIRLLLS